MTFKTYYCRQFFEQPQLFLTLGVAVLNTINTHEFRPSVIPGSKFKIPSQYFVVTCLAFLNFCQLFNIFTCCFACIASSIVSFTHWLINHCCFGTSTLSPWAKATFLHMYFLQYVMEDEHIIEPSQNNPEEAADYVKAVNLLLQSFVNDIHGFNCYKCQDAYKTFLHSLSQLLSKLDSAHFTNMDTEVVLDTIPDKVCAAFLACPEEAANKVQQRVSSDSIPTGPEVTSKMCLQGNIPCFDQKGQQAITKLFGHLQDTHNHMSEVAKAVVDVSEVSSPEQFTFVLQLAVRPIIQLKNCSTFISTNRT